MHVLYTAEGLATGDGRNGHGRTTDGMIDLDFALPPELGGKGGAANPEQLFAVGYAVCFHNALRRAAKEFQSDVEGSSVTTRVGIGAMDDGRFGITVGIAVDLPKTDQAIAERVLARADEICPYSNATRGNVELSLTITGAPEENAA
jgi:lipoyl-dependent peroxiredoxin